MVEAGAGPDVCNYVPPTLEMANRKLECSLFTLSLLHSFTLMKLKEVSLTG